MNIKSILNVFTSSLILMVLSGCQLANKNSDQSQIEKPSASITDTYWKLIELEGQEVEKGAAKKSEVHFILHEQDKRIAGFNGCNRFFGNFNATSDTKGAGYLSFKALGATKMACRDLDIKEQQVMQVFYNQSRYKITGESLTLFDDKAKPIAKFAAIYF